MITRIREVRRARGLTLDEVAARCDPPTTPQTIGRLETGTRTVSVGWLNRIAAALEVDASDLVAAGKDSAELPVAAYLGRGGANAPRKAAIVVPPRPQADQMALVVSASIGDYRAGDAMQPDILRFGFTPLYIGFEDAWQAVEHLKQVLDSGEWQRPEFNQKHAVT